MPGPDDEERDDHGRWTSGGSGDTANEPNESDRLMSTMSRVTGIDRGEEPKGQHKVSTETHSRTLTDGSKNTYQAYIPMWTDNKDVWHRGPKFSDKKEAAKFAKDHKGKENTYFLGKENS